MVAILHYLWLLLGSSLYDRMAKNTHGQPEVFGGVTSTDDGLALTIGPTASSLQELTMQAAANANLWHRRPGYLNRKSLNLLKNLDNNGVGFDGPVPDCDVCAVGKSYQLAHRKTAYHS